MDTAAMVTPNISGLRNPNFTSAAAARGIRYVVSDTSSLPAGIRHNTGVKNPLRSTILEVPRRPTNIFYNTVNPYLGAVGSQTDEYNYFYGPNGISRVGGPGGPPFFNTDQSYAQIVEREAQFVVLNMLRGEVYPVMFHQANLSRYNGMDSLLTDFIKATLEKFRGFSNIPARSLSLSDIGEVVEDRMAFNASGVSATLTPGLTLSIRVSKSATIPITGLCRLGCEQNGPQSITLYSVNHLLPTLVLLP
jgi:hypothetical protein